MKKFACLFRGPVSAIVICLSIPLLFNACKKHDHNPPPPPADGSVQKDGEGACIPVGVYGTWYSGTSIDTSTNYATLTVLVTSPGKYHIYTDTVNGVSLESSGIFTATGKQPVVIRPKGRFTSTGLSEFRFTFDSTSCRFYINVLDSLSNHLENNTISFVAGGHLYKGTTEAHLYDIPQSGGASSLSIKATLLNSDTTMLIDIGMSEYNVKPGSYPTSYPGNDFAMGSNTSPIIFSAYSLTAPAGVLTYKVTSYDYATRTAIATFDGTVLDKNNSPVAVTNGVFKVILQ